MLTWLKKQRKSWKRSLLFIVLLALSAGAIWYFTRPESVEFSIIQAERRDIVQSLEFTGQVNAQERVQLRFAAGGKVVYLGAQEGDQVVRGQTLATIDRRTIEKNLEKQLSTYETQRRTFENSEDAWGDSFSSEEERRNAEKDQFALDRSVLDVEIQSLAIESTRLSSPISGLLVDSPVNVTGVNLAATDVFEVVNPDTLYFQLFVDEVDIDRIYVGQKALVRLDSQPDAVLEAVVSQIALKAGQSSSGTVFPVDLTFISDVSIEQQRLGMNGEAEVVLAERTAVLTVPVEAVVFREGGSWVEVMVDGERQQRSIEIGVESDEYVEILSGLNENDQVVLP